VSHKAIDWAFAQPLDGNTKMILVYLARRANEKGVCFPSHRLIAKECGCSPRTVSRALTTLRDMGLVEGDRRGTNHTREPKYYVLVGWLAKADTPPVASLDTSPVAVRSVSKKNTGSGVLRTPSRRRSAPKGKSKAAQRREAQAAEDALDPDNDPRLADAEEAVDYRTAPDLAAKFKRLTAADPTLSWNPGGSMKALSSTIAEWMRTGLTAEDVSRMIDAYAMYPGKNTRALPWKEFVSQRAMWHDEIRRADKQTEVEEHRYGSREYWLGSASVPTTNTTKAGDND